MRKTDGLSRRLDWKVSVEKDNKNQIFIKDCWLHSLYEVVIEGPEVDIIEKIKKARSKNEEVVRVVEEIKKAGVKIANDGLNFYFYFLFYFFSFSFLLFFYF